MPAAFFIPWLEALPPARRERDRMVVAIDGGPGVGTQVYICLEQPDTSYDWVEISTGGAVPIPAGDGSADTYARSDHEHAGAGTSSVAVGTSAAASAFSSTAVGQQATASGNSAIAVGRLAVASNARATAIGYSADAVGFYSVAIGGNAYATDDSVAIGDWASAAGYGSFALGEGATIPASSHSSIAIGYNATIPASSPDTGIIKVNDIQIVRSNGTGVTRLGLLSPDGTIGWITVTDTDGLVVNSNAMVDTGSAQTLTNKTLDSPTISALDTLGSITDGSGILISDPSDGFAIKVFSWGFLKGNAADYALSADVLGSKIAGLTNATIDGADSLVFADASDTNDAKRVTWTSLLLTLGSAFQALDSDLTAIAGLSASNDDIIQRKAGAWTNRAMAQVKTDLALAKGDVGLGNVENVAQSARGIDVTIGPFYANDLAATSDVEGQYGFFNTATALSRSGNGQRITRAGKVVGVIATTDKARTGGTLTVRPRINGIGNSGITAVINGTNTTSNSTFSQTGVSFSANATIDVSFLTSSWGPTTADATAWLVLRLDDF